MTERVDFYVLDSGAIAARDIIACRLAEKGFQQGLRIYIRTADATCTDAMDGLLWGFSSAAFVPHMKLDLYRSHVESYNVDAMPVVVIGNEAAPEGCHDMLVSLVDDVPEDADRFARVADLIASEEQQKQLGRARFRIYRDRGAAPEIHNL